jgi:hypothetical protein
MGQFSVGDNKNPSKEILNAAPEELKNQLG